MSNNKKAYIIAGVGVVVVVLVVGTLMQVEPPSPTGPLCQALASLMLASVIGLIVGALVSFLAEYIPKWDELDPKLKRIIVLLLCMAIPFLGLWLRVQICGLVQVTWDDIALAVAAGWAAFTGSQLAHTPRLRRKP